MDELTLTEHIDKTILDSGGDIVSKQLNLIFNQPSLFEIFSILGQDKLLQSLALLNFENKKENNENEIPDFYYILSFLKKDKEKENNFLILLNLILVKYNIHINYEKFYIYIEPKDNKNQKVNIIINYLNFSIFKYFINEIYYLYRKDKDSSKYNAESSSAKRIVRKLEESHRKINSQKKVKNDGSLLSNAILNLSTFLQMPIVDVYKKYTIVQFYSQLKKFQKREKYQQSYQALLVGAKDIEIESWYENI